jgi:trans-2,3-dihydro-3-hydroxyanthranilate isomerase
MAKLVMKQVDAFTTRPFCGNPAGVILRAEGVSVEVMQRIASELNTLESTFVSPPDAPEAAHRVRFFTPDFEYNFSGHAMLATCFALAEEGLVRLDHGTTRMLLETNAGIVPVDFHLDMKSAPSAGRPDTGTVPLTIDGRTIGALERIMIHRITNEFRQTSVPGGEIAKILGIPESEIRVTGLPVQIIFSGISQLIVPVQRRETVSAMNPDLIRLRLLNEKLGVLTTDVFTLEPVSEGCVTYSRHFSPAMGMWEDDASGAGAASIAAYLVGHGSVSPGLMIMEQGRDLERLSRVVVEVGENEDGNIPVQFGGLAVTSTTREIVLEDEEITVL